MASVASLASMVLSVRRRAKIENQYGFISDQELVEYLNYCLGDLYDRLVQNGGQEFYRKTWPIITNTTDSTYPLPPDFFRLTSVDAIINASDIRSIRPFMEEERNMYQSAGYWGYGGPMWYRMQGKNITFLPKPGGTFTCNLNGYPTFTPITGTFIGRRLTAGADSFDGINGWEEEPIWRCVAYVKEAAEYDSSFARARVAELQVRINGLAASRDARGPERINDVSAGDWDW